MEGDIEFSYQYNVLKLAGNKKLAKKEDKQIIKSCCHKIFQTTRGRTLRYGQNFKIYSGTREAFILDPQTAFNGRPADRPDLPALPATYTNEAKY
jgi:hypothetical protein